MRKRWVSEELVLEQLAKYIENMELVLSQYNPKIYLTQVKILSKLLFLDLEKNLLQKWPNKQRHNKWKYYFLLHQSKKLLALKVIILHVKIIHSLVENIYNLYSKQRISMQNIQNS